MRHLAAGRKGFRRRKTVEVLTPSCVDILDPSESSENVAPRADVPSDPPTPCLQFYQTALSSIAWGVGTICVSMGFERLPVILVTRTA